ncbi:DUF2505 domain-containing protein [Nocardia higoensis]|uniref:DUF2505 domain-containing protein n=1 Tax=Nocardia higoensis TaxID=228599 RepID=UPI00031C5C1D|nr:DUF2505 domain-containing protein [Nocardia higoensis]
MATPLAYTAAYIHSVSAVRAAFSDEQYWKDRITEVGGPNAHLESVAAEGDTVRIHMVQAIAAELLPPAVTAVRPGDLIIPRTETWNGNAASYEATVEGAPAKMSGIITLTGDDNAATAVVDGTIEVKVPLFGGKIEAAIKEHLIELLRSETEFTNTWLSGR